jgi:hypothetical protein
LPLNRHLACLCHANLDTGIENGRRRLAVLSNIQNLNRAHSLARTRDLDCRGENPSGSRT